MTPESHYPFDVHWKATVDRSGPEWRAYCEAVALVKRYIATRRREGRASAVREFEETCERCADHGTWGRDRARRVRDLFQLVWTHERDALAAQGVAENEGPRAA